MSGESGNQDKCNMDSSQAKEIEALKIGFCVEKKINWKSKAIKFELFFYLEDCFGV